jgi:hypothetical protein
MEEGGLWIFVAAALALDAWAVWLVVRTRRFLARAVRVSGTVLGSFREEDRRWKGEGQGSEDVVYYYPEVAFNLPDGQRVVFRSRASSDQPAGMGQTVTVVYDPLAPAATAAMTGPGVWQPVMVWVILAGLGTIVVVVMLIGAAMG